MDVGIGSALQDWFHCWQAFRITKCDRRASILVVQSSNNACNVCVHGRSSCRWPVWWTTVPTSPFWNRNCDVLPLLAHDFSSLNTRTRQFWQQVQQHSRIQFEDNIEFDTRNRAGYFLRTWTAAIRCCSWTRVAPTVATQWKPQRQGHSSITLHERRRYNAKAKERLISTHSIRTLRYCCHAIPHRSHCWRTYPNASTRLDPSTKQTFQSSWQPY